MCNGQSIESDTTETVVEGTVKTFSTTNAKAINGYTVSSVSPTSATITNNITVTYSYTANVIEFNGDYDKPYWFEHYISSSTGEIAEETMGYDYATTAFLRYDSNNTYKFTNLAGGVLTPYRVFYYDSDKNFISCDAQSSTAVYTISSAPTNTKYFRLRCKRVGDLDTVTKNVLYTVTKK